MIRNFFQTCDYENGYLKAISDIKNWISNHSQSLKYNKCVNLKDIISLLNFFEQNREDFIKIGEDLEIGFQREGKIIRYFLINK